MRLKRVEVTRFGRLQHSSFGDFSEGLNVVVGPNEAGKTTIVNFVRQALFGYVGKRKAESPYLSLAGKRLGRLVFTGDHGEWSIERIEGAHGGAVKVTTLEGSEYPDLLGCLTKGVSEGTYRVVFGFGISELAQIEDGRISGDGVLSRLYAAQTGSAVSPADVKKEFKKAADALKTQYNKLKAEIKELNGELAQLEAAAADFASERQRLDELGVRLDEALETREKARSASHQYALALERFENGKRRLGEIAEEMEGYESEYAEKLAQLQQVTVDQRVLERASQLEPVIAELSGFRQRLAVVGAHDQELAALSAKAERILSDVALDSAQASEADIGPETMAGIEKWREQLAGFQAACDLSSRDADEAEMALRCFTPPPAVAADMTSPQRLPAAILFGVGLLLLLAGALLGEVLLAVAGFALAAIGVGLHLWLARGSGTVVTSDLSAGNLEAQAMTARKKAEAHAERFSDVRGEWRAWLGARGLAFSGEDPAAVSTVASAIKQWRDACLDSDKVLNARARDEEWCQQYKGRLSAAGGDLAPGLSDAELQDVPMHAEALRKKLNETMEAAREREAAARDADRLKGLIESTKRKRENIASEIEDVLASCDVATDEEWQLSSLAESAGEVLRKANEDYDTLHQEHTALTQVLDLATQDSTMAERRLRLAEAQERRAELVDNYAASAIAARLIACAQDHHRQARQPEVIRKAGEIFTRITAGKYSGIAAPDEGGFMVFDQQTEAIPSSELSTGTVQQLYLALRFALVETLDGIGEGLPVLMDDILVNADPVRRERTAKAISELSSKRQVILFTCHPDTAELFEQIHPSTTRINL